MTSVPIWDPYERLLWGIAITFALICGGFLINRGRKREILNERIIMFGLASLPIGFALTLLITYLQAFYVPGVITNNIFIGNLSAEPMPEIYELFARLSFISLGMINVFFVLAFEIIAKRTRYLLTIAFIIVVLLEIILPLILDPGPVIARIIYNIPITLGTVFMVPIVLYYYTKWSRLKFKAVSSFLFFGFILFIMSLNLAKSSHKELDVYPLVLGPLFLILGSFVTILPTIVNPRLFARPILWVVLYTISTFTLLIIFTYIDVINDIDPWYVPLLFVVSIMFVSIMVFLSFKNIRSEMITIRQKRYKESDPGVLGIFSRPEKITEEEVSISKEKKICLVCKGKIGGLSFMCSDCGAFYCLKCFEALSNLENICWACNTHMDPAKPVKLIEEKEDRDILPIK